MSAVDHAVTRDPRPGAAVTRTPRVLPVSLDAVAALAARSVDAATAIITLAGDRGHRIAGGYRLPAPLTTGLVPPLDFSIGGYVVGQDALVNIPDLAAEPDPALRQHPLAVRYGLRAFLGVPLRDGDDRPVGALSVLAAAPRRWTDAQVSMLVDVAHLLRPLPPAVGPRAGPADGPTGDGLPADGLPADGSLLSGVPDVDGQGRFLAALLDGLAVGVAACDSDGRMVVHNRAFVEAHGLPDSTRLGDADDPLPAMMCHPDGVPMSLPDSPLMRAARGESVSNADVVIKAPGRRSRTFMANSRPITGQDGRHLGAVLAAHDVTAIRRAEAFRACEQQVVAAVSASTVADAAPAILRAVATTLGWPHAELWLLDEVGDTLHAVGHFSEPGMDLTAQLLEPARPGEGITGTVWATGRPLWVPDIADTSHLRTDRSRAAAAAYAAHGLRTMLAVPLHTGAADDGADTVVGVLACFADTSEDDEDLLTVLLGGVAAQLGRFLAVRRAHELAEQLARSRDHFITLVGHEMRTPLTSISSYAELLGEEENLSADARQMVQVIDRNATAMCGIVDNLLDLAGLESGGLPLVCHEVDLVGVVTGALRAAGDAAAVNRVTLHADLPGRLPLHGDARRLRQLVDHVLDNAITYSPDGGDVVVRLHLSHSVAELSVTDHGIGIPAADLARLFDRFYRAGNVAHHGIPGNGLGLATVRAIARLHGGTVELDTRDGTTVLVRLPDAPHH